MIPLKTVVIAVCVNLSLGIAHADSNNLLENGSFENWTNWTPVGNEVALPEVTGGEAPLGCWLNAESYESNNDPAFPVSVAISKDEKNQHAKSPSVKIENKEWTDIGVIAFKPVKVLPNQTYKLTVWYKAEDVEPNPKPGDGVGVSFWVVQGPEDFWSGQSAEMQEPENSKGTFGWEKFEYVFTTKETTEQVSVNGQLRRAKGSAWFADFELTPVVN